MTSDLFSFIVSFEKNTSEVIIDKRKKSGLKNTIQHGSFSGHDLG